MNDRSSPEPTAVERVLDRAVCCRCGCFCDDIALRYDADQRVTVERACPLGETWLQQDRTLQPTAMVAGQAVELTPAIHEATRLIDRASAPVVEGLAGVTLEAAREAVLLARDISATLIPRPLPSQSFLRSGIDAPEFTATLGKVRTTADLVIFWRADPRRTHPRHLQRYSFFAPLINKKSRTLVVADNLEADREHLTAQEATCCVDLQARSDSSQHDLDVILTLELLLRSQSIAHLDRVACQATVEKARRLAQLIRQADHTHIFLGEKISEDQSVSDAFHALASRVRAEHHVSVSNLAQPGNAWGVQELTTWLLGAPGSLWLTSNHRGEPAMAIEPDDRATAPFHLRPTESTVADAFDLHVRIGVALPGRETDHRETGNSIPRIAMAQQHDTAANVSFAIPGLDPRLRGTVMRSDGIMLTLCGDAALGVADPTVEILQALRDSVSIVVEQQP